MHAATASPILPLETVARRGLELFDSGNIEEAMPLLEEATDLPLGPLHTRVLTVLFSDEEGDDAFTEGIVETLIQNRKAENALLENPAILKLRPAATLGLITALAMPLSNLGHPPEAMARFDRHLEHARSSVLRWLGEEMRLQGGTQAVYSRVQTTDLVKNMNLLKATLQGLDGFPTQPGSLARLELIDILREISRCDVGALEMVGQIEEILGEPVNMEIEETAQTSWLWHGVALLLGLVATYLIFG